MRAQTAADHAALSGSLWCEIDAHRAHGLHRIGDVVSLYEKLEATLTRIDEGELLRIAARTGPEERPLAFWARRIARARGIQFPTPVALRLPPVAARRPASEGSRFVWEAVAFAVGFGVSFLLIVGGA